MGELRIIYNAKRGQNKQQAKKKKEKLQRPGIERTTSCTIPIHFCIAGEKPTRKQAPNGSARTNTARSDGGGSREGGMHAHTPSFAFDEARANLAF